MWDHSPLQMNEVAESVGAGQCFKIPRMSLLNDQVWHNLCKILETGTQTGPVGHP